MLKVYKRAKGLVAGVNRPVLPVSMLFFGLSVLVQGQTVDPLTGLPLDPLTGLPIAAPVVQTQAAPQAPTAQPASTTPSASTSGFVRVTLRPSSSSAATAQRASLRVPTAFSSSVGGVSRVSTRTFSTGAAGSPVGTSFGSTAPIGTGTSTGGNAQTNKNGNTVGKWAESSNIIDMGATSGTIDLVFATGPKTDQMTIYYPPRGQAGSQQIKDTGRLATPNRGKDLARGAQIKVAFGPGTSTQVEIVVNEGALDARSTVWSYTGTGTGANGSTVTINGSMNGSTSSAPAAPVLRTPVVTQRPTTSLQRVNLRQP